jgi:hypothetical protein
MMHEGAMDFRSSAAQVFLGNVALAPLDFY